MQSVDELLDFFSDLVEAASGVPNAILADQGRDPPEGLYATYNPTPVRAYGHPKRVRSDAATQEPVNIPNWSDIDDTVVTTLEFMLSCNFFNEGARDAAWKMPNANFRNSIQKILYENKVAWRYCSEIKNLTDLLQAGLQPRYHVDVFMFVEGESSEVVLKAAAFNINVTDKDGNQL